MRWRKRFPARTRIAGAHHTYKKRFAVRRKTSTNPDVMTTVVMLSMLRAAVDSTFGNSAAGAAGLARPDLDFDRLLAAIMMNSLGSGRNAA